nr:cell division protein ZapA [uncultured Desulfobulbus sp.]
MEERLVRFTLFGQEFTFYSDASEDEVDAVIALLREELEGGQIFNRSTVPSSKMLVLGCLRITAKYIHLQREHARYRQVQEEAVAALIEKILPAVDPPI